MKIGTLCSGIGTAEMATKLLLNNCSIEYASDIDPYVKQTYIYNHNPRIFYDDVNYIDHLPFVNLMVFGSPCQPFSVAGKGLGLEDPRGKLLYKILDLVDKSRPDTIIGENVEGFLTQDGGKNIRIVNEKLERMGYYFSYKVLDSLDFGVPQQRKRCWYVAAKSKQYNFPVGNGTHPPLATILDTNPDENVYVTPEFLRKPKVKKRMASYNNDYINCITRTISRNGSSKEYTGYVAAVHHAIGETRKPTVNECCRLFGIPNDFHFPDSVCTTRRYDMLANSMVVPVLKELIRKLIC